MSTRTDRRPTTATVTPLALSDEQVAESLAFVQEKVDPEATGVSFGPQWGISFASDGSLHAVCTEGVGYEISDGFFLEIPVYYEIENGNGSRSMSMMPCAQQTLDLDEIVAMQEIGDDGKPRLVPLHEWVRSFGSRLEQNYEMWRRTLER